ncbi:hypothetical protein BJ742DRAFT_834605 [Cladochytrium replicatum]|nr:hypothetical protein BJ742DRAFT_834605 [Cladochytrium replicatum]
MKPPDRPLLLYFHGGAHSFCSSLTYVETLGQLGRLAGIRIISLEYGLAPATKFPARAGCVRHGRLGWWKSCPRTSANKLTIASGNCCTEYSYDSVEQE